MDVMAFLGAAAPSIIISIVAGGGVAVGLFILLGAARKKSRAGTALVVGLLAALFIFGAIAAAQSYTTIPYGTVGLVTRFGGLTNVVYEPGLHWRIPFIERVVLSPTVVQSYETSDDPSSSGSDYTDIPVNAQTIDGQQILIKYTVLFRIPPESAVSVAQNIGPTYEVVQNVIKAHSRNLTRLWAQNYTAEDLYSGEGIFSYEEAVKEALSTQLARYGVVLDDFLVRKVDFATEYVDAIEQQQIAQEAIETAQYQADAAAYERDRQVRLAEADAQRTRLLADAEAYSIQVRGAALADYPQVVQWEFVRNLQSVQWGILPSEGVAPFIPIPSFEGTGGVVPPSLEEEAPITP